MTTETTDDSIVITLENRIKIERMMKERSDIERQIQRTQATLQRLNSEKNTLDLRLLGVFGSGIVI